MNAATPAGPSLSSVSFVPTSIVGGQNATGTVRFTAPMTQGAVVQLSSSNPAIARVPQETVVSANASTGTFNLATSTVTTATSVTITARWFAVTRTATVTVSPGAPPAADIVRAILSVYSRSGSFMFDLTNKGGGRYADQRSWVTNPQQITVRSKLRWRGLGAADLLIVRASPTSVTSDTSSPG